jgi:hypothetical protein
MWSVHRPKNRDKDEAVRPDSTRKVAEMRTQTLGRQAANVMIVGPPGCCGCVTKPVSSSSRRKS